LKRSRFESFLFLTSLAVLLVCGYYASLQIPSRGSAILWEPATWIVRLNQTDCADQESCLEIGDRVLEIDGVSFEDFSNDRTQTVLTGKPPYKVIFSRDGAVLQTMLRPATSHWLFRASELLGPIAFPFLFWLAGTLAAALGPPKDPRRLILIAFCFDTALFFSSGYIAYSHQALSIFVVRITGAFFLPLAVHLHLSLPVAVDLRIRQALLPPLYLLATAVALADLWQPLPAIVVYSLTFVGLAASLALLAGRALVPGRSASVQRSFRLLLAGSTLGITPWLVLVLLFFFNRAGRLPNENLGLVLSVAVALSIPNWPLAFLYTLLRSNASSFELRVNRAMGAYGFWSLYVLTYLFLCLAAFGFWPQLANRPLAATVLISLPFVMVGPIAQPIFQRWLDRRLGIRFDPSQVVSAFASRIPTAFERSSLRQLIEEEILPALLIRQAALMLKDQEPDHVEAFSSLGVDKELLPSRTQLDALMEHQGQQLPSVPSDTVATRWPPWIKLVIPLESQNEELGAWLLGRRDPDDDYPAEDRQQIAALANQIAAVVRLQRELDEKTRLQSQLMQSQKMEAVGRLSAGVAHDFNNFLSAILGYSELLEDLSPSDPGFARYLGGIREAAEKASALTTQLLAFSRRQAIAEQLIDLGTIVERLENLLRRVLASGIDLTFVRTAESLPVRVDPGQLEQVLVNLVVNASDAMTHGGRVEVSTSRRSPHETTLHPEIPSGRWAVVTVKDDGSGIAPEVLEHIFEPFFTTKKLGQGTGLGLAMVYGIVQRAGGYVAIETEVGRGSTFLVFLPLLDEEEAQHLAKLDSKTDDVDQPEGQREWDTKPGRGLTILLVEDEPNVRQSTADLLRVHGFSVLECADGFAALELCDQYEGRMDLLLSDVMMPHLSGPELADRLLMRRPELKVLFISGYNEEVLLGKRLEKSGARLLRKPCPTRLLIREIRSSLGCS